MKVRLRHLWEIVSSSYWFVPSVMTAIAGVAALVLLHVDRTYLGAGVSISWLYSGGSEGAKTLLSTVAGSIITVAGVVFSITIAALTQASSQFGPRLLRNFMRDVSNQIVLGTFVATFLYCLLVLRTIHGKFEDGSAFVPQASVTGAVLLAIASIAVLIYFIHHISMSLQAPKVVAAVRRDFGKVMDDLAKRPLKAAGTGSTPSHAPMDDIEARCQGDCRTITADCDGYIQAIDDAALVRAAISADALLRLEYRAGDYVIAGNPLVRVWPVDAPDNGLAQAANEAVIRGGQRTAEQDLEYSLRQIVEIAVRALSPGINDPFTAVNCINALGSAICRVARTGLPEPYRFDAEGKLRLVIPATAFAGLADVAFNQIRQYGRDSVAVTTRLLEVIASCAPQMTNDTQRQALLRHAQMIYRQSQNIDAMPEEMDREDVKKRFDVAVKALEKPGRANDETRSPNDESNPNDE